ncbi:MAG: radical SAM protein [Myxococcota bacterium]
METSQPRPRRRRRDDDRAVIDEGMQAEIASALEVKDLTKEAAVKHRRHWVRLTRLCNQRCIFCLDSWNHNGTYVDTEQLKQYIDLGVKLGRERLILSGGEPTVHPDYLRLIRYGRNAGYDWIQTVTNGMMFAYPEFTRKCLHAGLNEVTMSIHGHTAKLQDRLCGVKGAFDKAVEGIKNIRAMSGARTVINIDVVINKQNIRYLRDIIDFFRGMDIHEFDLLYIVPFGRGFEDYRHQLYFDMDEHHDDLQRALEVSREPGVFIWTNRLPPEHLEGYEDLIQAPHKLHSEVQGGLHNFEGWIQRGVRPDCHGSRCPHCFLKGLCHDHIAWYLERLDGHHMDRVYVDLSEPVPSDEAAAVLDAQRPRVLTVRAPDLASLREYLAGHPYRDVEDLQVVAGADEADAGPALLDDDLSRVSVTTVEGLEALTGEATSRLAGGVGPDELPDVEFRLDGDAAAWILARTDDLAPLLAAGKLVGHLPNFEYLSDTKDNAVGPEEIAALRDVGVRLMNVTPCLGGDGSEPGAHFEISRDMLDEQGRMKVTPYVDRYIRGEYYKKSVRCRQCVFDGDCKGMHIQFLRAFGFRSLQPVAADEPAAAGAPVAAGADATA